jgi:hypothetical protein
MAFRHAGIIQHEIPGLDTPQGLFVQLRSSFNTSFKCKSGHVGIKKINGRYELEVLK